MSEKPLKTDKPPIIEEVDEPKEKKRLYWPWIVGGCVILSIVGFVILCGILFAFCISKYQYIGGT